MIPVYGDFILSVAPRFTGAKARAQARIVGAISAIFAPTLDSYEINSKLRIAHFMGQVTHECAGFTTTQEFASGSAYEGRKDLGNIHPGDGRRYKGRGLIQLTGRANHREFGERLGLPLEDHPDLAAEPVTALKIACEYWKARGINIAADMDDLIKVTRLVNGGLNGLEDRRKYLQKAKAALMNMRSDLRLGSTGDEVKELQAWLRVKGFAILIDGDFGPRTRMAVTEFQGENGLFIDGVVGPKTLALLRSAPPMESEGKKKP